MGEVVPAPASPIPSHCASIVVTSTLRVKELLVIVDPQNHLAVALHSYTVVSGSFQSDRLYMFFCSVTLA